MFMDYAVIEKGCFDDYSNYVPHAKTMSGNGINTFILHVSHCITFNFKNSYSNTYCRGIVKLILFKVRFKGY